MKCINCNTDNKPKERNENRGHCKSCNHEFVFEPTEMPSDLRFTDSLFARVIADISKQNTLFFTPRQLYYLLEQKLRSKAAKNDSIVSLLWGLLCVLLFGLFISNLDLSLIGFYADLVAPILFSSYAIFAILVVAKTAVSPRVARHTRQTNVKALNIIAVVILVFGIPLSVITKTLIGVIGSICLGIIAAWLSFDYNRQQPKIFDDFLVDWQDFDDGLKRWISINDLPEKMLASPKIATAQVAPNPKVIAYDFDRVVVCDSPKIAQLLLKNNFHFENNCAVMAIDRYPQQIFMPMKNMLDRIPNLKVYAVHDCSPQGLRMIRHLRSEQIWFPDLTIPIIDVGILPRQIRDNSDVMISQSAESAEYAKQLSPHLRNSLDATELAWLEAGFYLELESFPPQKLIQILQRAISESHQLAEIEAGDLVVMDSPGFYTIASFG